ncbi:MAG: ABC transporter permease, partial [Ignavibacteriaceae bacterium]
MFGISFVSGNNNNALSNVFSIVMTQKMAEKYFGSEEPIGKTVRIDNRFDFTVTGIIKNYPSNSHLKIDFLLPFQAVENFGFTLEGWNSFAHTTYVLLAKGIDYHTVSTKIKNTIIRNENDEKITISLQPVTDIHLYSDKMIGIGGTGDITQVYIFSVIALLILLLACINFMNLSTARAGNRSKEIGMRKVVGARRKEIILQFFFESIVYAVISLMLSIFWIYDLLPLFNSISGKELAFNILNNSEILLVILGVAIFTGILSGIYPALVMSAFKPVKVLKGSFRLGSGNKIFRKVLVTSQFVLTIVLITGTVVVNRQLHFIQNKSLGFNKDQLLSIKLPGELNRKFDLIKDRLQENRGVINIAGVSY